MSSASHGATGRPIAPGCPNHRDRQMVPSVVELTFGKLKVPAAGFRCDTCGTEIVSADAAARAQEYARTLGTSARS